MIRRREMLGLIGGATAAGLTGGAWGWVSAQSGGSGGARPAPTPAAPEVPKPPSEEARALADIARTRYGTHLKDVEELTRAIDRSVQGAATMAKVPLSNADEPDSIFSA